MQLSPVATAPGRRPRTHSPSRGAARARESEACPPDPASPSDPVARSDRPVWDDQARELWWGAQLIKRFRNDAANQRLILQAFEEQGWPARIDDPLPPTAGINRKSRLRETVRGLHHGQKPLVLRFHADGTGSGVRWEAIE
jgi:hypothetical protein